MKRLWLLTFLLVACARNAPPVVILPAETNTARPPLPTVTLLKPTSTIVVSNTAEPTATVSIPPTPTEAPLVPVSYRLREVVTGLTEPVVLAHARDGSGRLFVVEQPGRIRVVQNGELLAEPFLNVRELLTDRGNEQGLLGLVFHPRYAENGFFFINYTDKGGDTIVARYSVSAEANRADPASAKTILKVRQPYANHNGGDLAFGPDGYLYIGLGDGGSGGDPQGNGQNLTALLGKMLRIDVDNGDPYAIPPDNPFATRSGVRHEIWATGLRNPWRFSFDRGTGDLFIADVGQNQYEEVNYQPAASRGGENYGWNYLEGLHEYAGNAPAGLSAPIFEYSHAEGCSVTGGYVYRGASLPGLQGVYLVGDYCSGQVWALTPAAAGWQADLLFEVSFSLSAFGEDEAGELYLLDHRRGGVYQLVAGNQ